MLQTLKRLPQALIHPGDFFSNDQYIKGSLFAILAVYALIVLGGSLCSLKIMSNESFRDFQVEAGYKQALKMNPSLTDEDKAEVKRVIRAEMEKPYQKIITYVSTILGALLSMVGIVIFWVYMMLAFRFIGGEETPVEIESKKGIKVKKHRRSFYLAAYAFIPLGLAALMNGIMIISRNPDYYLNMLTMADVMDKMNAPFSLYTLLINADLPLWIELFLNTLTSPFHWWFGYIVVTGAKEVLRVPPKKSIILVVIYLLLVINYQWGTMSMASAFGS